MWSTDTAWIPKLCQPQMMVKVCKCGRHSFDSVQTLSAIFSPIASSSSELVKILGDQQTFSREAEHMSSAAMLTNQRGKIRNLEKDR